MARYIQRSPCQPKAVWWKKYTGAAGVGKRTIYVATPDLGYEVDGYPQALVKRILVKGVISSVDSVEYIKITEQINGVVEPIKAICLCGRFYMFNNNTISIEEQDVVEEDIEIVQAQLSEVIRMEQNVFVRQCVFDCVKENDLKNSIYQPIQGFINDSSYLTLKTHSFCNSKSKPTSEDLVFYQGRFWIIDETNETYLYTPREQSILHISLKAIHK